MTPPSTPTGREEPEIVQRITNWLAVRQLADHEFYRILVADLRELLTLATRAEALQAQPEEVRALIGRARAVKLDDIVAWPDGKAGALALINALVDALFHPPTSGWLPIESAPGDGTQILLIGRYPTDRGWSDVYHAWFDHGGWTRWPHGFSPTHWRPLPHPPTSGAGQGG